ncbi:hypothetical protein HOD20_01810 [archaeon]|jgi:purine nucleoside phosphorylase|nr:hypothetical protein [archaeon]MBT4648127.1 hypothetical protein [archaeon]MBT6822455.1 hypothetical protein [archaeon]MBT7392095.1 hypothetical protein [archaeon]
MAKKIILDDLPEEISIEKLVEIDLSSKGKLKDQYDIAVIGGTGFKEKVKEYEWIFTDYGPVKLGHLNLGGKDVLFYSRHDRLQVPDELNRKAYMEALKMKGVKSVIGITATGRLSKDVSPGHFVVPHKFNPYDLKERDSYTQEGLMFFGYPTYISHKKSITNNKKRDEYFGDSPALADMLINAWDDDLQAKIQHHYETNPTEPSLEIKFHKEGVYTNINGPGFFDDTLEDQIRNSLNSIGHSEHLVIGQTKRELYLARELGMDYVSLAMVTDNSSLISEMEGKTPEKAGSHEEVSAVVPVMSDAAFYIIENALKNWDNTYTPKTTIPAHFPKEVDFLYLLSRKERVPDADMIYQPKNPTPILAEIFANHFNLDITHGLNKFYAQPENSNRIKWIRK